MDCEDCGETCLDAYWGCWSATLADWLVGGKRWFAEGDPASYGEVLAAGVAAR
jgi:hypothetical protein